MTTMLALTKTTVLGALTVLAVAACGDDETKQSSTTQNATTTTTTSVGGGGSGGSPVGPGGGGSGGGTGGAGTFTLTSPAFMEGEMIPAQHVCDQMQNDPGLSPQLDWTGVPTGTLAFAVVMKDLTIDFNHWVIWDIPASATGLDEGVPEGHMPATPTGAKQAESFAPNFYGYIGPCSPNSVNTYQFTVYAVDVATLPNLDMQSSMDDAVTEIEAHDVGSASLSGES
jgi:Raf kinase inhibitor-like YbhB/YbcL family protein